MAKRTKLRAFSLIEVVIAVGIFSFAVISILALLPLTVRQAAGFRDLQTATQITDAIRLEVQRVVPAANYAGFTSLQLVAARDGTGVRPLDPADTSGGQYYLIDVAPYAKAPLQYAAELPLLVLTARISWPYGPIPPGAPAAASSTARGEQFSFVFALRP